MDLTLPVEFIGWYGGVVESKENNFIFKNFIIGSRYEKFIIELSVLLVMHEGMGRPNGK